MAVAAEEPAGDCRVCGLPSWLADEYGPAHPCCVLHEAKHGEDCPACRASRQLAVDEKAYSKRRGGKPRKPPGEL